MPHSESDELSNDQDGDNGSIKSPIINNPGFSHAHCPPEIHRSCFCVRFIAEHTKLLEDSTKVSVDLKSINTGVLCIVAEMSLNFSWKEETHFHEVN